MMNTICNTGSQVQQQFTANVPTPTSVAAAASARNAERFVTLLSFGAILSVVFCICLTNLGAQPALNLGQNLTRANASIARSATASTTTNLKPVQTQTSLNKANAKTAQASALDGLNVVPKTSAWPMVGLGFLLLLARGRALSSAA